MPQTKQAKKSLKKDKKKAEKNKEVRSTVKTLVKKSRQAVAAKDSKAKDLISETIKKIDRAAQKGIIKKNTAARKKSRLVKNFYKNQASK